MHRVLVDQIFSRYTTKRNAPSHRHWYLYHHLEKLGVDVDVDVDVEEEEEEVQKERDDALTTTTITTATRIRIGREQHDNIIYIHLWTIHTVVNIKERDWKKEGRKSIGIFSKINKQQTKYYYSTFLKFTLSLSHTLSINHRDGLFCHSIVGITVYNHLGIILFWIFRTILNCIYLLLLWICIRYISKGFLFLCNSFTSSYISSSLE